MVRKRYHHGELRRVLLDAAEELVRERGEMGWSLREASAQVGVSPSAAYHHFASRDALMHALSERVLAQLGTRMSAAAAETAGPDVDDLRGILAAGRAYVRWITNDPAVARLAFGFRARGYEVACSPHPQDVIEAELDRLVDAGVLSKAARDGAGCTVWAAVHGLGTLLADKLVSLADTEVADLHTERLLRAVLAGLALESIPPRG
ncbi:TetR/AcrR family transcriptional regulator [Streptomyces marokkonensis]|uniref:TetR/AcrR family transcriptional regulator n=1 Tax=Streptomyces marokkonensis TaxID=324855 RepID=A0ABW6QIR5_9ACTN